MTSNTSRRKSGTHDNTEPVSQAAPGSVPALAAQPPGPGRNGAELGAPPSNTAPDNSNGETFKALRWGVDSLYLSYSGELMPDVLARLKSLKAMAQGKDREEQSRAQYPLGDHLFEVKDKGTGLFPYILEDGAFRIQLSRGDKVPVAYVKVSAAFLAHVGPAEAERRLYRLLEQLATLSSMAQVSRIDLFCDFVWSGSFEWPRNAWITRAAGIDSYSENGIFTGWVVGRGGVMLARLYYKLLQVAKSGSDYLLDLWAKAGWNVGEHAWRLEFQIKREVLSQMGIAALDQTLNNLNGLWNYACVDWLRLAIPQEGDQTRSRWPINPLWGFLSAVDWEGNGGPLLRKFSAARLPDYDRLYATALSVLSSYMASEGIDDPLEGYKALMTALYNHVQAKAARLDLTFDEFLDQRVGLKARQYNTLRNDVDGLDGIDDENLEQQARAYRKASRG